MLFFVGTSITAAIAQHDDSQNPSLLLLFAVDAGGSTFLTDLNSSAAAAGKGGNIDIRVGVSADVGDGSMGDLLTDRELTTGEYYFRQVSPAVPGEALIIRIVGDVVIHCQNIFAPTIVKGVFINGAAPPRVSIYAGCPIRYERSTNGEQQQLLYHGRSTVEDPLSIWSAPFTWFDFQAPYDSVGPEGHGMSGGDVRFWTTSTGGVAGYFSAPGGSCLPQAETVVVNSKGGNGGSIDIQADGEIFFGEVSSWGGNGGGWSTSNSYLEYDDAPPLPIDGPTGQRGGDGGNIRLKAREYAKSPEGTRFSLGIFIDAGGGNGGNGRCGKSVNYLNPVPSFLAGVGGGGGRGGDAGVVYLDINAPAIPTVLGVQLYAGTGGSGGDGGYPWWDCDWFPDPFTGPDIVITGGPPVGGRGGAGGDSGRQGIYLGPSPTLDFSYFGGVGGQGGNGSIGTRWGYRGCSGAVCACWQESIIDGDGGNGGAGYSVGGSGGTKALRSFGRLTSYPNTIYGKDGLEGEVVAMPPTQSAPKPLKTLPCELVGIEVNQSVQDLHNSVLLVAGKQTLVRAYVQSKDRSSYPIRAY